MKTFSEYVNLQEGKNEDAVSILLHDHGMSEELVVDFLKKIKEDDLNVSTKSNYLYIKRSGNTQRTEESFFKSMLSGKDAVVMIRDIFPDAKPTYSRSLSGAGNSGKFKYTASVSFGLYKI